VRLAVMYCAFMPLRVIVSSPSLVMMTEDGLHVGFRIVRCEDGRFVGMYRDRRQRLRIHRCAGREPDRWRRTPPWAR